MTVKKMLNSSISRFFYPSIRELFFRLFRIRVFSSAIRFIVGVEIAARPRQSANKVSDNARNVPRAVAIAAMARRPFSPSPLPSSPVGREGAKNSSCRRDCERAFSHARLTRIMHEN